MAKALIFLGTALALNLAGDGQGKAPTTLEVIPAGPRVRGLDGREWLNDRPQDLLAALNAHPVDLPLDFNHATELRAPKGEESPAAAWMRAGRWRVAQNGAIEAELTWSERGRAAVEGREYRYVSPALIYDRGSGRIVGLSSAGLVPKPNLAELPALNAFLQPDTHHMNEQQLKALCAALGLPEGTAPEKIVEAAAKARADLATAMNQAHTPDLAKFVPRADYEVALNRASAAEGKLATQAKAAMEAEAAQLIDGAVREGKIAPASKDFYLGLCADRAGLDRVKEHLSKAPAIIPESERLPGQPPASAAALNSAEAEMGLALGVSAEDRAKYGRS